MLTPCNNKIVTLVSIMRLILQRGRNIMLEDSNSNHVLSKERCSINITAHTHLLQEAVASVALSLHPVQLVHLAVKMRESTK